MKREDVRPGGEYATDLGEHVRIADEPAPEDGSAALPTAGWSVQDGEWVRDERFGQRLLSTGAYRRYQMNVALRAIDVSTGEKIAVEPRRLVDTWDSYVARYEQQHEQAEQAAYSAAALETRAAKAKVSLHADAKKQEVRLSFADADTLLRLVGA